MATASETKVIEAYIGLLGRAPDPSGLAYWTAQLDAAGGTTDALKKLTNDITLSAEWDAGLGAQKQADGSISQANADKIVGDMYQNLFERAAAATDLTYWGDQLIAGTVTSSEMAVLLIAAANENGTADGQTLAFKTEAATYYAETVSQADFSRAGATSSVADVAGPQSLADSKAETDAIATGVGTTAALTTAADTPAMTGGDEVITGVVGSTAPTFGAADNILDLTTTDSDTVTLTGDEGFISGTISNVEAVNISLTRQAGAGFELKDMQLITGSTINLDVGDTYTVGSGASAVEVAGETVVDMTADGGIGTNEALVSNLNTTDVTKLTFQATDGAGTAKAISIVGDVDLKTIIGNAIDGNDTSITTGNNDSAITVDGTTGTADAVSITAVGDVALDVDGAGAQLVEKITLSGSNDVDFAVTGATAGSMTYTVAGSQDVKLSGNADQFNGSTLVQSGTGKLSIDVTEVGTDGAGTDDLDLTGQTVGDGVTLSDDIGNNTTGPSGKAKYSLDSGTVLTITAAQDGPSVLELNGNDTATDSSIRINLNENGGKIVTEDYEVVTIATNESKAITINDLDASNNDATVSIVSTNDVTITAGVDSGSAAITAKQFQAVTVEATPTVTTVATNGFVTINASDSATLTDAITAGNDITVTATNEVRLEELDSGAGTITITGNDVAITKQTDTDKGAIAITANGGAGGGKIALGDTGGVSAAATTGISMTSTQALDVSGSIVTTTGNIVLSSANDIDVVGIVTATAGSVTLTSSNDAIASGVDALITGTSVNITDGKFALTGITTSGGAGVTISGDTDITASGTVTSDVVTVTSTNDVVLTMMTEADANQGVILAGAAATGKITVSGVTTTSGTATLVSGSGVDNITVADVDTKYVISTGGGVDTVTVAAGAYTGVGNTIATGGDGDLIDLNATSGAFTIDAGAGDDTVELLDATVTGSFDLGDGTGDKVVLQEAGGQTYTALGFKNIEELDITAGDVTLDSADVVGNDATFKLTGAGDTLILAAAAAGGTADFSGISGNALAAADIEFTGNAGNDVVTGAVDMVNVLNGAAGVDTLTGGEAGDTLNGGTGADTLNGGDGNDNLVGDTEAAGDSGADTLSGGNGSDSLTGGRGADSLDGGAGTDTVFYSDVGDANDHGLTNVSGMAVNLSSAAITAATVATAMGGTIVLGGGAGVAGASLAAGSAGYLATTAGNSTTTMVRDTITTVEDVTGSALGDYIVGSATANTITGGGGADVMTGGTGADQFKWIGTAAAGIATETGAATGDTDFALATAGDKVVDFATGSDKLVFAAALVTNALGTEADTLKTIGAAGTVANTDRYVEITAAFDGTTGDAITDLNALTTTAVAIGDSFIAFMNDGNDGFLYLVQQVSAANTIAAQDVTLIGVVAGVTDVADGDFLSI